MPSLEYSEIGTMVAEQIDVCLRKNGASLTRTEINKNLNAVRRVGATLQREVLEVTLTASDRAYLSSEFAFGVPAFGVSSSLPMVLGFGASLGALFHALLGQRANQNEVKNACALFNAGIVLFDRCCDNARNGVSRLRSSFDRSVMEKLTVDPALGLAQLEKLRAASDGDVRVVLGIIKAFYGMLWRHVAGMSDLRDWYELNATLLRAYRAELECASGGDHIDLDATRAKSILPFEVFVRIAALWTNDSGTNARGAFALARDIGLIFWLLDDLADLESDLRSNNVNLLVSQVRRDARTAHNPLDSIIDRLRHGPYVQRTLLRVSVALKRSVAKLRRAGNEAPDLRRPTVTLLTFVNGWSH